MGLRTRFIPVAEPGGYHLEQRVTEFDQGKPFAILPIDIDEFKGVNNASGRFGMLLRDYAASARRTWPLVWM